MTSSLEASPVFIGGIPRSGTTLLRSLLDGHPQLVVHPGTSGFFTTFVPMARDLSSPERMALAEHTLLRYHLVNQETTHANGTRVRFTDVCAEFGARLQESAGRLPDYLGAAVTGIAAASGVLNDQKQRWVEKSCFNELRSAQIFEWWPAAKLIQLIRDPRATYAARWRRAAEHNSIAGFARSWEKSVRIARSNTKMYGASRCLAIRYESLVEDPAGQASRIAEFLEIRNDPSLLQPTTGDGRVPWKGNSAYGKAFLGISPASLHRWRELLTARQAALLDLLLSSDMVAEEFHPRWQPSLLIRVEAGLLAALNRVRDVRDWLLRGRQARPVLRWFIP